MSFVFRASPASRTRTAARTFTLLVTLLLLDGCLHGRRTDSSALSAEARRARITALERAIEADRETLAAMVTRPRDVDFEPLHDDEMLRTVADRLRRETAELNRLRAEDAEGEAP